MFAMRLPGSVTGMVAVLAIQLLPLSTPSEANIVDVSHRWLSARDNGNGTFSVTYVLRFSNVRDRAVHNVQMEVVDVAAAPVPPPASARRIGTLRPGGDATVLWRLTSYSRVDAARGKLPLLLSGQGIDDVGESVTFDTVSDGRERQR